jgi:hypothetical protein
MAKEKTNAAGAEEKPATVAKARVSMGRIVIATVSAGGSVIKRPAIVSQVKGATDITAFVFMEAARPGDFVMTQFKELKFDASGRLEDSWAWPGKAEEAGA